MVRGRQLIRVHRGVYAVGHRRSNPIDAAHAALLAGGERSALAGFLSTRISRSSG